MVGAWVKYTGQGHVLGQLDQGDVVLDFAVEPIRVDDDGAGSDGVRLRAGQGSADVVGAHRHGEVDDAVSAVGGRHDPSLADERPAASGRLAAPEFQGHVDHPRVPVGRRFLPAHDPPVQVGLNRSSRYLTYMT